MYLSKASTYGIRSVAYLATKDASTVISVKKLSSELQIPAAFLTKVMQRLAARKIVVTMRGFGGGISLGKPAEDITLKDVITAIDGEESFPYFKLGISEEQLKQNPAFYKKWNVLLHSIETFFSNTRLTELGPGNSKIASLPHVQEVDSAPDKAPSDEFKKQQSLR